ncbi:hypothetical protein E4H12_15320 [Candidatus Thorarchaeota archaeon]|nr:MAG: hypothetical protein E4H12_15320 [Candidatus Thorarchaeota archaeon]
MISKITEEIRCHKNIYAALVILHVALLITNGFGTGFQNTPTEFEVELGYGSPISQDIGQTVIITDDSLDSEVILVNQTPYSDEYSSYLSLSHCTGLDFTAEIEVMSPVDVHMWLQLFTINDSILINFRETLFEGSEIINLQITLEMIQNSSWSFVDTISAGINYYPIEGNAQIVSFVGRANFSSEICPVVVNIVTTDNDSLSDYNPHGRWRVYPELNISMENTNYTNRYLNIWNLRDGPIFLEPGNYSGDACWRYPNPSFIYERTVTPINLQISTGMRAQWIIRLLTVRIDMLIDPKLPWYSISIEIYSDDLYFDPYSQATLPPHVYVPPLGGISFVVRAWTDSYQWQFPPIPIVGIIANSSYHISYTLKYPYSVVLNTILTPNLIALMLYIPALFIIISARIVLRKESSESEKTWLSPRLIPILILFAASFFPWYYSFQQSGFIDYENLFLIYKAYYFPYFLQTLWTTGSVSVSYLSTDMISPLLPMLFFWIPLIYATSFIRAKNEETYIQFSIVLLVILLSNSYGWLIFANLSRTLFLPGLGLIITIVTCIVWIVIEWWREKQRVLST